MFVSEKGRVSLKSMAFDEHDDAILSGIAFKYRGNQALYAWKAIAKGEQESAGFYVVVETTGAAPSITREFEASALDLGTKIVEAMESMP